MAFDSYTIYLQVMISEVWILNFADSDHEKLANMLSWHVLCYS